MQKKIEIGDSCRVRNRPETWILQGFSFGGRIRLSRRDGAEVMLVDTDDVTLVVTPAHSEKMKGR
jgi:hypothetical protein